MSNERNLPANTNSSEQAAEVATQTIHLIESIQPSLLTIAETDILKQTYNNPELLNIFNFYRINSFTTYNAEDISEYLTDRTTKLFTALYSLGKPVLYGVVSHQGVTDLIIGLCDKNTNANIMKGVMEGLLDGAELNPYDLDLHKHTDIETNVGIVSGVPCVKVDDVRQPFSLAPIIKSLNGQDYCVFFVARPVSGAEINNKYSELITIRDKCFAVSKQTLSSQEGTSTAEQNGTSHATTNAESVSHSIGFNTNLGLNAGLGLNLGVGLGRIIQIGAQAMLGGFKSFGFSVGQTYTTTHSVTDTISKSITETISQNNGISYEVQNGFAVELMSYADKAIQRYRQGSSCGMWETAITYSSESPVTADIIRSCIAGELSKPVTDILPYSIRSFRYKPDKTKPYMLIPKIFNSENEPSQLCTDITSEELGMLCTIPTENVPDFELKTGKKYPVRAEMPVNGHAIGKVCDNSRVFDNMKFALNNNELVRHTFVCGTTGSGKTTTVKRILSDAGVPFLVIEPAKAEYRNIKVGKKVPTIYTPGEPEINSPRINPFYIPCGVSPQLHIDYLKDLFNASFSFYGPMPYILEKCLNNIYINKGWDLSLGIHPLLYNTKNPAKLFEASYIQSQYKKNTHKYLFPTMQDLKDEVNRYIKEELDYDGEVAGNIRTAIKARLESLCVGAKGYMFNTYDYMDIQTILSENTIFELEGLADDSDKAFCLGLLIVLINEYRQTESAVKSSDGSLSHLLVIEEAHRLLKNVNTDRSTEDLGNPKGKAVEHFTNMLAEMRAYGQGVIVAEQIPTKLAPDVIKNSSNKIVHRLVAADDQQTVANTICLAPQESMDIGLLKQGECFCHKEGMTLPIRVMVDPTDNNKIDNAGLLINNAADNYKNLNFTIVKETLGSVIPILAFRLLNSMMALEFQSFAKAVAAVKNELESQMKLQGRKLVVCSNPNEIYSSVLAEAMIQYTISGIYAAPVLPDADAEELLTDLIALPNENKLSNVREKFTLIYGTDLWHLSKRCVAAMILKHLSSDIDIAGSIKEYYIGLPEPLVREIEEIISRSDLKC